jgi:hypothetical protein
MSQTPLASVSIASSNTTNWKLSLAVACIPAIAAIIAAITAARAARVTKRTEIEAQRLRDLEGRISEKKYDTYRPMLDTLKDLISQQIDASTFRTRTSEFTTWISIYGSDEAVKSFHNFMQASFHNAPAKVLMKLYAEFIIAARRDMGNPSTKIRASHFLGMRINDIYDNNVLSDVDSPLESICRETGWTPPWPTEG